MRRDVFKPSSPLDTKLFGELDMFTDVSVQQKKLSVDNGNFELAKRVMNMEDTLKPKKVEMKKVRVTNMREQNASTDDGLTENIRRYRAEKTQKQSKEFPSWLFFVLFVVTLPTIVGPFILLLIMSVYGAKKEQEYSKYGRYDEPSDLAKSFSGDRMALSYHDD
jgi:hypothetical protein